MPKYKGTLNGYKFAVFGGGEASFFELKQFVERIGQELGLPKNQHDHWQTHWRSLQHVLRNGLRDPDTRVLVVKNNREPFTTLYLADPNTMGNRHNVKPIFSVDNGGGLYETNDVNYQWDSHLFDAVRPLGDFPGLPSIVRNPDPRSRFIGHHRIASSPSVGFRLGWR